MRATPARGSPRFFARLESTSPMIPSTSGQKTNATAPQMIAAMLRPTRPSGCRSAPGSRTAGREAGAGTPVGSVPRGRSTPRPAAAPPTGRPARPVADDVAGAPGWAPDRARGWSADRRAPTAVPPGRGAVTTAAPHAACSSDRSGRSWLRSGASHVLRPRIRRPRSRRSCLVSTVSAPHGDPTRRRAGPQAVRRSGTAEAADTVRCMVDTGPRAAALRDREADRALRHAVRAARHDLHRERVLGVRLGQGDRERSCS